MEIHNSQLTDSMSIFLLKGKLGPFLEEVEKASSGATPSQGSACSLRGLPERLHCKVNPTACPLRHLPLSVVTASFHLKSKTVFQCNW